MKCRTCGHVFPKEQIDSIREQVKEVREITNRPALQFNLKCPQCGKIREISVSAGKNLRLSN